MTPKKLTAVFLLTLLLFSAACPSLAATEQHNPMLTPYTVEYARTEDDFLNILLMGIDVSSGELRASGDKWNIMDSHTDVVMLLSINKTKGRIDLVSIPRDTLVYVPGVHGVYKLNAAFNTATNPREGFRHVRDTVSWLLGGVRIDAYCAVDMTALRTLIDVMGGIDYDLEMTYRGSSGTRYKEGFQHLDGLGVVDYVRARKNATVDRDDIGRTNRDRKMMIALFDKLKSDMNMLNELWATTQKSSVNFFTDMNGIRVITDLWDFFQGVDSAEIGSHMMEGEYVLYVLGYWNLNITDQAARTKLIKEVYGINAKEIPYTSKEYCSWLLNGGFQAVQNIRQAQAILEYAKLRSNPSKDLKNAISALEKSCKAAVSAFDNASAKLRSSANKPLTDACKTMRKNAEKVVKLSNYPEAYTWEKADRWYQDPLINDYYQINWN